ncbi:hypothetical protein [Microbaculum marinum]|uniref:PepSY domain-containing protein n=1 Tax=Microbaculum marinum TaxID=1764581 RepID=A0AAW9RLI6_9HYPH
MAIGAIRISGVWLLALAAATGTASAQSDSSSTDDAAEGIVSAQLRAQGYPCSAPHSAEPDKGDSSPGETAWIITCDNATYRVKLVPDQAAKVEQID